MPSRRLWRLDTPLIKHTKLVRCITPRIVGEHINCVLPYGYVNQKKWRMYAAECCIPSTPLLYVGVTRPSRIFVEGLRLAARARLLAIASSMKLTFNTISTATLWLLISLLLHTGNTAVIWRCRIVKHLVHICS